MAYLTLKAPTRRAPVASKSSRIVDFHNETSDWRTWTIKMTDLPTPYTHKRSAARPTMTDSVRQYWPWFVGFGACLTALMLGILSLTQTNITWPHRIFWILLGLGGLGFLSLRHFHAPTLTPAELERLGMGQIVAQASQPKNDTACSLCGKPIQKPVWQRDRVFCSQKCKTLTKTRMEAPRYFLPPPLPPEAMIRMLDQAVQLAERALHAASKQTVDQPLLLAAHRGQGAIAKVERVALSLDVWGWSSWADQLRFSPPPEPLPQGGYQGDPQFLQLAGTLQQVLKEHSLPINPFELLQLSHALDRQEFAALQNKPLSQKQQETLQRLGRLLEIGERRLLQVLSQTE